MLTFDFMRGRLKTPFVLYLLNIHSFLLKIYNGHLRD
uniref:Uncharacterized protein n=1 Tax=Myoviridae sp. ctT3B27 TaxID=2826655 RepID=A0A8S5NB03_9CAUD|nr:MAG TPA: hypothetical protein [Myoviridae sp. ctT3B27]